MNTYSQQASLTRLRPTVHEVKTVSLKSEIDGLQKRMEGGLFPPRVLGVLQHTRDAILLVAMDGRIAEANEAAERLYGYSHDEILKLRIRDLCPADGADLVARQMEQANNEGILFEARHRCRDGSEIPVEVNSKGVNVDGEIQLLSVIRDIRSRCDARRASEERFRAIVEKSSESFLLVGRDGNLIYASPSISKITGIDAAQLVGRRFTEHTHPDDREECENELLGNLLDRPQEMRRLKIRVRHADGSWRVMDATATNLLDAEAVGGVLIHFQDVTERDELERQLRYAQKMEAVGTLAGGLAHDFNNMLFAIMGFTTIAMRQSGDNKELQVVLEQVMQASRRSSELVRQLLLFSKQGETKAAEISVGSILTETCKLVKPTLPATVNLSLRLEAECDIVKADPIHVQQVIMSLCANAAHAMRQEGGGLDLSIQNVAESERARVLGLSAPCGWLCLTVADSGSGIPAEHMDRIFEPFFTTKRTDEGTGLGLSVVHGIVASAGGHIEVASEVGKGTTFRVFLPLCRASIGFTGEASDGTIPPAMRVVYVDDEPTLTEMMVGFLTIDRCQVSTFGSGEAARDAFLGDPSSWDLMIADYSMPGMNGLELIEEVRRTRPGLPAVLITGDEGRSDCEEQCRTQSVVLKYKPLTLDEMRSAMVEAMRIAPAQPS
jgi:two-component system, cell cycle sensor histidine kinase and response regulator CckA